MPARPRGTDRSASPTRRLTETAFARTHPLRMSGRGIAVNESISARAASTVAEDWLASRQGPEPGPCREYIWPDLDDLLDLAGPPPRSASRDERSSR